MIDGNAASFSGNEMMDSGKAESMPLFVIAGFVPLRRKYTQQCSADLVRIFTCLSVDTSRRAFNSVPHHT